MPCWQQRLRQRPRRKRVGWGNRCCAHVVRIAAVTVNAHLCESSNTGSVFLEVDCGRAGARSGLARSADVALGHDRVVAKGRKALARNDIVSTLLQARVKAAAQLAAVSWRLTGSFGPRQALWADEGRSGQPAGGAGHALVEKCVHWLLLASR